MRHLFTTLVLLCIALPATAQPNRLAVVERVAAADAARFACAHTDRACAYDFITALVCELRREDPRWGMNGRRGDPSRPSWDAINYCGAGPATDPTGACRERVTIIDVIAAAGSSAARPTWQAFASDPTPGAWIVPDCGAAPPPPTPQPPTPPSAPVDIQPVLDRLAGLEAVLIGMGLRLEAIEALSRQAAAEALNAAVRASEIKDTLAARPNTDWPEYVGAVSLPGLFGGQRTITMRPRPGGQ